jgi:hypothetical protein
MRLPLYSSTYAMVKTTNGPKFLGYEISGNDLILKDYKNNTLCTLTGVISNV